MPVTGTTGNDTVSVQGATVTLNGVTSAYNPAGNINLDAGADLLTVSLASVNGNVIGGPGNDSITLASANVGGNVSLDSGSDRLVASLSTINGTIDAGTGDDLVSLSSIVSLDAVGLGAGNDTLTAVSINTSGNINAGTGNTTINIANSTVGGSVIYVNNDSTANAFVTLTNTSVGGVLDDFTVSSLVRISLDSVTITGSNAGFGILTDNSAASSITLNASSVTYGIYTSSNADLLSVSGSTVNGTISVQNGNDTVILNTVTSLDGVSLGSGTDSLTATSISVSGNVDAGSENDTLAISLSTIDVAVDGGTGDDFISLNTIVSLNDISLGTGADALSATSITMSGYIYGGSGGGTAADAVSLSQSSIAGGVLLDDGADTLSAMQSTIDAYIDGNTGNDSIVLNNVASLNDIYLGADADTLNATSITVSGYIYGGTGGTSAADAVTLNLSSINGGVLLDDGADDLSVSQSTINAYIDAGTGNDTLLLNTVASLDAVYLGSGADALTASSMNVSGNVEGGTGSDLFSLANSTISGNLYYVVGDATADSTVVLTSTSVAGVVDNAGASSLAHITLTNSTVTSEVRAEDAAQSTIVATGSSLNSNLWGATGADSISISNSTVNGQILTQTGNDSVVLASVVSIDAINLGAGADTLQATSINVSGNIDAGTGNSAMTISYATVGGDVYYVNADSSASGTLVMSNSSVAGFVDDWASSSVVNIDITSSTITGTYWTYGVNANNGTQASVHLGTSSLTYGVLTGVGADTISLEGNTIGGPIDASEGKDRVFIDTKNVIGSTVTGGTGTDTLVIQGTTLSHNFTISLAGAATLADSSTTTLITDANYGKVVSWSGGAITGTVHLGGSGDTFAVNSFEKVERIVCFGRGTRIRVADGDEVPVETLRIGDLVQTADTGPQPVRWIGMHRFGAAELAEAAHLRPIRIAAGALGRGLPERDLVVSPQHRMLVSGRLVRRMFGVDEVLVAAKQLLDLPGIDRLGEGAGVDYFHIMFDRHQLVFAEGAPTESFFAGPEAVSALDHQARAELFAIFPDLEAETPEAVIAPARVLVSGRRARSLAGRCAANGRALLD